MTAKRYIDRGVEKEVDAVCQGCIVFFRLRGASGTCMCEESDHYCHVILKDHPACKEFVAK